MIPLPLQPLVRWPSSSAACSPSTKSLVSVLWNAPATETTWRSSPLMGKHVLQNLCFSWVTHYTFLFLEIFPVAKRKNNIVSIYSDFLLCMCRVVVVAGATPTSAVAAMVRISPCSVRAAFTTILSSTRFSTLWASTMSRNALTATSTSASCWRTSSLVRLCPQWSPV